MRKLLVTMFVALLMVGCGEDIEVPKLIKCDGCGKEVSSAGEACANCSHPIADSVDAYVEFARIGAEDLDDPETRNKVIAEAIDGDTLQLRGKEGEKKLAHAPNQETPYTGWVKEMYDNGQIKVLMQVEGGKTLTIVSWKPNGEKCLDTNLVNGNGVVVLYNDDGTEFGRLTFKDGKIFFH